MDDIKIGIFGGSGLYSLLENVEEIKVDTPYGPPSDKIAIADYNGKKIAFLPRHGKTHSIPPHMINYRANIWAMKSLGVKFIISPTAAGSLQKHIKPGDFVVVDQFVDRTKGRIDTFYDGPVTTHIFGFDPYCSCLRTTAIESIKEIGVDCHETGTVVIIQGPRFSTKAESKWFSNQGWEVINMTQYPEAVLAREQEMCFTNISLITDYDAGLIGEVEPVTVQDILTVFKQNITNIQKVIFSMVDKIDINQTCSCHNTLASSRFND